MIDGIDGCGKDTVADTWKEQLIKDGNTIFDVRDYWKKNGHYPERSEMKSYDFVFTAEPTYVGVGKVIREELTKQGTNYPDMAIAQAFSLDRLVHYERIVIPALNDGQCVIQVRGVSTSLCYQSLSGTLSLATLASLPGNTLALEHRPDHLVLLPLSAEQALGRLAHRLEKNDNAIFEKQTFLEKAAICYASQQFQELFISRGTQIQQLPADTNLATMKAASLGLLPSLIA